VETRRIGLLLLLLSHKTSSTESFRLFHSTFFDHLPVRFLCFSFSSFACFYLHLLCFAFIFSFLLLCLALLSFFYLHLLVFAFTLDNAQDNLCILLLPITTKQLRNSSTLYREADEDKQRLSAA
jgi:hypothetical protein